MKGSNVERTGRSSYQIKDHTDWLLDGWRQQRPDLNVSPIAIVTRLSRLLSYLQPEIASVFERFDLTAPSFAVIATLRRAGAPYRLSQRALMDALQLTSGTISVRIDRLSKESIVERFPDPNDQRGVLVQLTEKGQRLFDQVAPLHLANEDRLLSASPIPLRQLRQAGLLVSGLPNSPIPTTSLPKLAMKSPSPVPTVVRLR